MYYSQISAMTVIKIFLAIFYWWWTHPLGFYFLHSDLRKCIFRQRLEKTKVWIFSHLDLTSWHPKDSGDMIYSRYRTLVCVCVCDLYPALGNIICVHLPLFICRIYIQTVHSCTFQTPLGCSWHNQALCALISGALGIEWWTELWKRPCSGRHTPSECYLVMDKWITPAVTPTI